MRGVVICSGFRHGLLLCSCKLFHFLYPSAAFRRSFTIRGPSECVTLLTSHGGSVPCGSQCAMYPRRQPPLRCIRIMNPVMYDMALQRIVKQQKTAKY